MCELQKVLLHQAGLRVISSQHEWYGNVSSSSNDVLTGTLCVSNTNDLREALQITTSMAEQRFVDSNDTYV
jgi:hypothetical protein